MNCKHYKGDGYTYKFNNQEINLCGVCHIEMAMEIMKQLILEVKENGEKKIGESCRI